MYGYPVTLLSPALCHEADCAASRTTMVVLNLHGVVLRTSGYEDVRRREPDRSSAKISCCNSSDVANIDEIRSLDICARL